MLIPGLLVGGLAVGVISPALAAAMVSVLPVERGGLASGINNTFRQLGIAVGIAGLGAIFTHHLTGGARSPGRDRRTASTPCSRSPRSSPSPPPLVAWPLLGRQRSTPAD